MDDYSERFLEGLAEACVADLLRARGVMVDGEAMATLQERLQEGVGINIQGQGADAKVVEKGGQVARLSLARAKPKMALESLDPMRESTASIPCAIVGATDASEHICTPCTPLVGLWGEQANAAAGCCRASQTFATF